MVHMTTQDGGSALFFVGKLYPERVSVQDSNRYPYRKQILFRAETAFAETGKGNRHEKGKTQETVSSGT